MTATYELISTVTVSTATAASIEFTSIPATYDDLVVKLSGRNSIDSTQVLITFNGSTTSFSGKRLSGSGSAASSDSANTANVNVNGIVNNNYTANAFGSTQVYIPNYAGSANKSFSVDATSENNATESYMNLTSGLWSDTSAITSVKFVANGGNFLQHSSASLYGIKKS